MSETYQLTKKQYEQVKHLIEKDEKKYNSIQDLVGKIVFIRTVTHYYVGRLMKIEGAIMRLEEASWIADTGRLGNFLKGEKPSSLEVEPMGTVWVNMETIVDYSVYKKLLPDQI